MPFSEDLGKGALPAGKAAASEGTGILLARHMVDKDTQPSEQLGWLLRDTSIAWSNLARWSQHRVERGRVLAPLQVRGGT